MQIYNKLESGFQAYIRHELELWGILQGPTPDASKVQIRFEDILPLIEKPKKHIKRIIDCANENSYLTNAIQNGKNTFLEEYNSWDAPKKSKFGEVSKTAVCHSTFLTIMTQWIESDFPRSKKFFNQLNQFIAKFAKVDIKGMRWYNYMDSFGNIKINTVFLMIDGMIDDIVNRRVLDSDKQGCGVRMNRISVNIAEAMYYDAKADMLDNALTGSVLVVTPASQTENTRLETRPPQFSANGIYQVYQPFPDLWADLYQVWNLAFTAQQMPDFPIYWAKLLNPAVGCYRSLKGSYLFQRGINLAMHIVHQLVVKNERKNESPGFDIRLMKFVASFGKSNKNSSKQYFQKVQTNDSDPLSVSTRKRKLDETDNVVKSIKNGILSILNSLIKVVGGECFKKEPESERKGYVQAFWDRVTGRGDNSRKRLAK